MPFLGLLVDQQSRSIRSLHGTSDSGLADATAVRSFDYAAAAPDGRAALVVSEGKLFLVRRLDGARPVWREFSAESSAISRATWSENATALALLSEDGSKLELLKNIPNDPKSAGNVDLTSVAERVVSLAVDKEARYAFLATQGESSGTLYLLEPGKQPQMIMPLDRPGALLLAGDSLFLLDRGRNEVVSLKNWQQNPAVTTVASAGAGLADPVGIALSPDSKILYVANRGSQQLLAVDVATSSVKEALDLDFVPTRLERLGTGSLFLLEGGAPGLRPAQIIDASSRTRFYIALGASAGGD